MGISSSKIVSSCWPWPVSLASKTNSTEDQSKENKVPSTQVTPEIPRPKNRASLITNAKEPLKIQDNNQAQNSVQPATASVNISSNQPDKSEASDDVFDQKPIEITETIDTRKNLNDVQHVVTKPLSHVISENNSQTGSVTSRSIEKEEMKEENTESMMQALDEFDLQQFEEIGLSETSRRMLMSRASQSGSVTK